MIQIIFDKESEFRWIKNALESGVMNISNPHTLRAMGVPLKQEINYKASDNYENDIKEKTEALLKRFEGMRFMDIERTLSNEYWEQRKKQKELERMNQQSTDNEGENQ